MASPEGADGAELPTQPLPSDEVVAAHVPIADLPTAPVMPPAAGFTPTPGEGRPRVWVWVVLAALAAGVLAAVVTGLVLGDRGQSPAPSPSITGPAPTVSAPATPQGDDTGGQPSAPVAPGPAPLPSEPAPPPTEPPVPTDPPEPTDAPS